MQPGYRVGMHPAPATPHGALLPPVRQPASARHAVVLALAAALTALVGIQIAWPVTHGTTRAHLTVTIVLVFALACLLHAALSRGVRRAAAVLAVTAVPGFAVEVLGVHTGRPFGGYAYTGPLGPSLVDVPLVVALAWLMMTWPAAVVARRLGSTWPSRVLIGAWAATAGDVFLDPQLVAIGGWRWDDPTPHLPGVSQVPLTNFAGWLAVTLVVSALLQTVMGPGRDGVGIGLYLWSWVSWTVALAVFLRQPAAAGWGALAMGGVAVPLLLRLNRS